LSFISRGPSDLPSPTIGREQTDKTNLKQIINIVRILSRKDITTLHEQLKLGIYVLSNTFLIHATSALETHFAPGRGSNMQHCDPKSWSRRNLRAMVLSRREVAKMVYELKNKSCLTRQDIQQTVRYQRLLDADAAISVTTGNGTQAP
jgi:hypothetical protein